MKWKKFYFAFAMTFLLVSGIMGQQLHVPGSYSSIQAAIDAATEGDTVLVAEGTYYENINYNGKAIMVASQFINDGIESHIENTIINGSQPVHPDTASVVLMISGEDTTSVLCGFTITGGKGLRYNNDGSYVRAGGGIVIIGGAKIENNIISKNEITNPSMLAHGAGIGALVENSSVVIRNNVIKENESSTINNFCQGGGIALYGEAHLIVLTGNTICGNTTYGANNSVSVGAGIFYGTNNPQNCTLKIDRNKIVDNVASGTKSSGGGLFYLINPFTVAQNGQVPNVEITNNIVANNTANWRGGGLWFFDENDAYHSLNEPVIKVCNNTLVENDASIGREIFNHAFKILLLNDIIWNENTPLYKETNGVYLSYYNCIYGGYTGESNINADPMLEDDTFELKEGSPCIGLGAYSSLVGKTWYKTEAYDFNNETRPAPIDHWIDIGAIESNFERNDDPTLIKVPQEISTIQAAINAASEGDTVLVAEGTYYENINFNGKAITVGSHFILDGIETHIENTIIDGSQPVHPDTASVVLMISGEDTTSVLCGFTITGGSGMRYNSDGIYFQAAGGIAIMNGAKITHNIIKGNNLMPGSFIAWGAGMAITTSESVIIRDNIIRDNHASTSASCQGGGIAIAGNSHEVILENNEISNNSVHSSTNELSAGGGIMYASSDPKNVTLILKGNKISDNEATGAKSRGGGIYFEALTFTSSQNNQVPHVEVANNIIANNSAGELGGGLYFRDNNSYYYSKDPLPVLANNTLLNNSAPSGNDIYNSGFKFGLLNNIIWNNKAPMASSNNGTFAAYYNCIYGNYTGEGNIADNPILNSETYELLEGSPCIGTGNDSIQIEGTWYKAPIYDFNNNIRPHPIDKFVDIGAIESDIPTDLIDIINDSNQIIISPNPVKQTALVETSAGNLIRRIELIDLTGKVICTYGNINSNKTAINCSRFHSGLYLLKIYADKVYVRKVIVE